MICNDDDDDEEEEEEDENVGDGDVNDDDDDENRYMTTKLLLRPIYSLTHTHLVTFHQTLPCVTYYVNVSFHEQSTSIRGFPGMLPMMLLGRSAPLKA